jgi:hypothetical protein
MAKRNKDESHPPEAVAAAAPNAESVESSGGPKIVDVRVPLAAPPTGGYFAPNLELDLTVGQAKTLWRVRRGLQAIAARDAKGRGPKSNADAVAFLLELIELKEKDSE